MWRFQCFTNSRDSSERLGHSGPVIPYLSRILCRSLKGVGRAGGDGEWACCLLPLVMGVCLSSMLFWRSVVKI